MTFGGVRYDLKANQLNETQIGMGYVDDCLILALNYITEYRYNTNDAHNHTVMLQFALRTIGGTSTRQGLAHSRHQSRRFRADPVVMVV